MIQRLFTLLALAAALYHNLYGDYQYDRTVVFTVQANVTGSGSHSLKLNVGGGSRTFTFSGSSGWTTSSVKMEAELPIGATSYATVTNKTSNIGSYRVFASQARDIDNLESFYVELGGSTRNSIEDPAGGSFDARTRLNVQRAAPYAGSLDYERAFNILNIDEYQEPDRMMRISLGQSREGKWIGFLNVWADDVSSGGGPDGIEIEAGYDAITVSDLGNSKRQFTTDNNVVVIEKGAATNTILITFYPLAGTGQPALVSYYFKDLSTDEFTILRTEGTGSSKREYLLDYEYDNVLVSYDSGGSYGTSETEYENTLTVHPWYKSGTTPGSTIQSISGYTEFETYGGSTWVVPLDERSKTVYDGNTTSGLSSSRKYAM